MECLKKTALQGFHGKANNDGHLTIDIKELNLYIINRVKELTQDQRHFITMMPKTITTFH